MTQAHWLDKIRFENLFKEKKTNKGFLEYSFQKSSWNFCTLFLEVIENPFKSFRTKFWNLGTVFVKMCFLKFLKIHFGTQLVMFFKLNTKRIFTKLKLVSGSSVKIKVRSNWTFSIILLTSAVYRQRFYTETRLCNIFRTLNAIMLVKTILESLCKVLQGSWEGTNFKRPEPFWKASKFLATFKI